jgi:thymidylate synthase (FAD)
MKLIKPSFEIIEQAPGIQGVKKQIELAGRTCYKSEDKITDTSCEEFVNRMINSGHGAMLEHGTVYLKFPNDTYEAIDLMASYDDNKYSKVNYDTEYFYITTNYRVLVENNWLDDLQYQCEPTEYHEKRITVKFICDRGVSHEFVRHRTMSFAQESTRYCNYCKSKFNNELIFIIPEWVQYIDEGDAYWHDGICFRTGASTDNMYMGSRSWTKPQPGDDADTWHIEEMFINSLYRIEVDYKNLITKYKKLTAQQARAVLPNALKTELVMTGFVSDWEHFFKLRCHSTAHPDARALAIPLKDKFIELKYINDDSIF